MNDAIVLDSSPLGVLCNPNPHPQTLAMGAWIADLIRAGRRVIIPEIADYEVRRELLRNLSYRAISKLDGFEIQLEYLPLTTATMRVAAELWAQARNTCQPTAPDHALDGDVILAAQAISLGVPVMVATGNPNHNSRFTPADIWQNITP